jgi:hypothetical protein
MKDPLAGRREAINRGETEVLVFPGDSVCPVDRGEVFALRSCHVEITHTQRKLIKGEWRWEARIARHLPDTPRIPASQHGLAHPPQYVATSHGAVDGIGEEVPRDYQERFAEEGRAKTAIHGAQQRQEGKVLRQEQRLSEARSKDWGSTVRYLERVQRHHERKSPSDRAA